MRARMIVSTQAAQGIQTPAGFSRHAVIITPLQRIS